MILGYWVLAITPEQELIKWGHNGDTVDPYASEEQATKQALYLRQHSNHQNDRILTMTVFTGGRVRTDDFDEE